MSNTDKTKHHKAGRPKGSTTRPQFRDAITGEERALIVSKIIDKINDGDTVMLKWAGDQIFGKAVQPLGNEEGKVLKLSFDNSFKRDE